MKWFVGSLLFVGVTCVACDGGSGDSSDLMYVRGSGGHYRSEHEQVSLDDRQNARRILESYQKQYVGQKGKVTEKIPYKGGWHLVVKLESGEDIEIVVPDDKLHRLVIVGQKVTIQYPLNTGDTEATALDVVEN